MSLLCHPPKTPTQIASLDLSEEVRREAFTQLLVLCHQHFRLFFVTLTIHKQTSKSRGSTMSRLRRKNNTTSSTSSSPAAKKSKRTIDLGWSQEKGAENDDDHIYSSDEDSDDQYQKKGSGDGDDDDDIEEEETLDAKKVRLAREYLRKLERDEDDDDDDDSTSSSSDDEEEDGSRGNDEYDRISHKLQHERLKREGTLERVVADRVAKNLSTITSSILLTSSSKTKSTTSTAATTSSSTTQSDWINSGYIQLCKGHDLTPTCVALCGTNGEYAISGSKDHSVLLWDVERGQRICTIADTWKKEQPQDSASTRTSGEVLSVACSDDGRYCAVGKRDATVCIYDVRMANNNKQDTPLVKTFTGHKGPVTSLAFRTQSLQLFSGSDDRCIRHYNLSELMYLETLYGHQFGVSGIDCHRKEKPVSVGRDRTARAWKLTEDTHLIYRGGAKISSADCVSVIKDDWFLTGHDDGHLSLWMSEKKRAVTTIEYAHGLAQSSSGDSAAADVGRGIVSIGALKGSDLAITGSNDGYLRLWKVSTGTTVDSRGMEALSQVPLNGFVNGIAVGPKARFCVVAVGQEPRLGRWNRVPKAKNRFGIVKLRSPDDVDEEEDDANEEMENQPDSSFFVQPGSGDDDDASDDSASGSDSSSGDE